MNIDFAPVAMSAMRRVISDQNPFSRCFPGRRRWGSGRAGRGWFEQAGVLSTAKTFPGHGDTATGSHLGLAKVTHSRAKMAGIDLPAVPGRHRRRCPGDRGGARDRSGMRPTPATVSKRIVTGLIARAHGIRGSGRGDSLGMQAVASRPKFGRAGGGGRCGCLADAQRSRWLRSGSQACCRILAAACPAGREAVMRVLEAKRRLGLLDEAPNTNRPLSAVEGWPAAASSAAQPS